jgi:drug/metabolite transporter (DMT)-like permease
LDRPFLLAAFAALSWSGNHIIGRAVAGHVPPFWLALMRWLLPALFLFAFSRKTIRRDFPAILDSWKPLAFLALSGGALYTLILFVGLQYTEALNVSVLNSLGPIAMVGAAAVIFRDYIVGRQFAGLAISLLGVAAILSRGQWSTFADLNFNKGDILIFINMMIFGIYAACLHLRPDIHWLSFAFVISFVSSLTTMPFVLWEYSLGYRPEFDVMNVGAALYVAIFPGFLVIAAWNRSTDQIGSNRVAPFMHLTPLFSAILATLFLGEVVGIFHVVGFALILIGVALASAKVRALQ